jgi:hypothetical protein
MIRGGEDLKKAIANFNNKLIFYSNIIMNYKKEDINELYLDFL